MSRGAYYLLFTASGFAGLIYESLWTHYLKLFLGHAAYAQSLVLVVLMGGMALGAAGAARFSTRIASPLAAYALVEAAIGLLALVFHPLFVGLTDWSYAALLPGLGGAGSLAAKLAVSCLLILPQSLLLGATFPLMSAGIARALPRAAGESVAMLYFTNSLGAAAGVLAAAFVLIDWLGLPGTLRAAGALNLLIAAAVVLLARPLPALAPDSGAAPAARMLLAVAFLTGLASFVYEIVWIRMLSLVLGASTHSFELMLATFILGLALGGLAVRRRLDAGPPPALLLGWVQLAMGVAALATLPVYDFTFGVMEALMRGLAHNDTGYALFNLGGGAIAAMVMLPATFCAGMTLPLITAALLRGGAGEPAVGRVYAANTLGAIAGVVLAVHVGLPLAGIKGSLIAAATLDAALGIALLAAFSSRRVAFPAAAGWAAAGLAVALGVHLDANKMTAGVYRHGDLEGSRHAKVLFARDGKTATVHLVKYTDALSLRTNGKSDGAINLERGGDPGTDEITMVLTGALPLALHPAPKSAAVIGIGTGLTTHTLLQSVAIERVETVEIEAAMVEASRGFLPRNRGAYADPRGTVIVDDAKTFFAAGNRRYDVIVSEPSNPWVSGVSSLFTREFYRRVREHLAEGGMLLQWFQLYEIDTSLVASVMTALGAEFPHYAVYAASDHDLLILASRTPLPPGVDARIFEQPGVVRELWTVQVLTPGDFDARFVGARATLEPLFASYAMPANSDYAPLLDLNAARHRFTDRSAGGIVDLLNAGLPLLELLDRDRPARGVNPLFQGAESFQRIENTRLAWYGRNFLGSPALPEPRAVPTSLQKDLEIVRARLIECRQPRELDVWLHSALRVAQAINPYLSANDLNAVWPSMMVSRCYRTLTGLQRRWVALFRAVGARDAAGMGALGEELLGTQPELNNESREYLLAAAMAGYVASGRQERAVAVWDAQKSRIRNVDAAPFRLLRCHAAPATCAAEFSRYAER